MIHTLWSDTCLLTSAWPAMHESPTCYAGGLKNFTTIILYTYDVWISQNNRRKGLWCVHMCVRPHTRKGGHIRNRLKLLGVPTGSRTPVAGVKGRCPRPLDDGDAYKCHEQWTALTEFGSIYRSAAFCQVTNDKSGVKNKFFEIPLNPLCGRGFCHDYVS